jgi:hypothetical protein
MIETIEVLFHDFGKLPIQIRLIKDLRLLKSDEMVLLLFSQDSSESSFFFILFHDFLLSFLRAKEHSISI